MEYNVKDFESNVDYDTHIEDFDGPLDLLLYLVTKAEIDIKDIFISDVTAQFLKYMDQIDNLDIEKAGEYLSIAATLLEIKSKELLPKVTFDDEIEEEDPALALIRKVEEYKMFKDASLKLKEQENTDRFYKEPDKMADDVRIVYKDFNLEGLVKAFTELMTKVEVMSYANQEKEIPKETFKVADKIVLIKNIMLERKECSFFELFSSNASKNECITTFQAMLELLKLQYLKVEQNDVFGDINIILREDRQEVELTDGQLDEYN